MPPNVRARFLALPTAGLVIGALLAACGGRARPEVGPGAAGAEAPRDTVTATIQAVDPGRRMLEVVTGRGMALQVYELWVPESVSIVWNDREVPLTAMVPGYVVHIEYRETGSGMVAERIREITNASPDPPELRPGAALRVP